MNDSDPSNIDRVGHRRWCLSPRMGKVGFGKSGRFSAMWVFDRSRRGGADQDVIAYPPRGYIPTRFFGSRYAWSVSLNTQRLERPDAAAIKVKIWPVPGGANFDLAKTRQAEPLTLDYFNVDNSSRGAGPSIIFRPENLTARPGDRYWVEIEGIKASGGKAYPLRYLVGFIE
jgi:hypothetical protein